METGNYNYAVPDPVWDYASVYHDVQAIKSDLDGFIVWLASHEEANPQIDIKAKNDLATIVIKLNKLKAQFT